MAATSIEWTDAVWNPVSGCARVSDGCDRCYALTMTHRLEAMGKSKYAGLTVLNPKGERHFNGQVRCHDDALEIPLRWKKPRRIFVNSMSDLFHKDVPFEFIDKVFAVMALCPQHTFQILTKRPERMAEYTADRGRLTMVAQAMALLGYGAESMYLRWPLPVVWLGTSVENQKAADERISHLLKCPAEIRFLSVEPLLGPVDLSKFLRSPTVCLTTTYRMTDWVIVGGESGPGSRPCNVELIRSIVEQCKAARVPCFVKQVGSHPVIFDIGRGDEFCPDAPGYVQLGFCGKPLTSSKGGDISEWPEELRVREMPERG